MDVLTPLSPIASLADTGSPMCQGVIAVSQAAMIDAVGNTDYATSPADLVLRLALRDEQRGQVVLAVDAGAPVGFAWVETPLLDNTTLAELNVVVRPDHRRRGVGGRLLAWAEGQAAAQCRTTLQAFALAPPTAGDAMIAPSGGRFPANNPGWRFAASHGYALEQVESNGVLDLPVDPAELDAWQAEATAKAVGYRLHVWGTVVPDEWIDGFAALRGQVTGDAPSAGLDAKPEAWDAARLRARWRDYAAAGIEAVTVAVEHLASRALVGFSQLAWRDRAPLAAFQGFTFVQDAHRGHRLGLWLKVVALRELAVKQPTVKRVHTENASENAPMLAINQRLGFRPDSVTALLQKRTT